MKKVLLLFTSLALVSGGGWLWWWWQARHHEQRLADCRDLRIAISTTRSRDFEVSRRR